MATRKTAYEKWQDAKQSLALIAAVCAVWFAGSWFAASTEAVNSWPAGWLLVGLLRWGSLAGFFLIPFWSVLVFIGERQKLRIQDLEDDRDAYEKRRGLREAVRKFYYQQREYLLLLRKSPDQRRQWVDSPQRFEEIMKAWREAKEQFDELRKQDAYKVVLADLEESERHELEAVWRVREELLGYATVDSEEFARNVRDATDTFTWEETKDDLKAASDKRRAAKQRE